MIKTETDSRMIHTLIRITIGNIMIETEAFETVTTLIPRL